MKKFKLEDLYRVYNFISMWETNYGEDFFDYNYSLLLNEIDNCEQQELESVKFFFSFIQPNIQVVGTEYLEFIKLPNFIDSTPIEIYNSADIYIEMHSLLTNRFKDCQYWNLRHVTNALYLLHFCDSKYTIYSEFFNIIKNEYEHKNAREQYDNLLFITLLDEALSERERLLLNEVYDKYIISFPNDNGAVSN